MIYTKDNIDKIQFYHKDDIGKEDKTIYSIEKNIVYWNNHLSKCSYNIESIILYLNNKEWIPVGYEQNLQDTYKIY